VRYADAAEVNEDRCVNIVRSALPGQLHPLPRRPVVHHRDLESVYWMQSSASRHEFDREAPGLIPVNHKAEIPIALPNLSDSYFKQDYGKIPTEVLGCRTRPRTRHWSRRAYSLVFNRKTWLDPGPEHLGKHEEEKDASRG